MQLKPIASWLKHTFRRAAWAPATVFILYVLAASGFDLYIMFPNLDMATHFIGGVSISYFYLIAISNAKKLIGDIPVVIQFLLSISLTAMTAVVWEFLEFTSDMMLGTKLNLGVSDIISDLFFGISGAIIFSLAVYFYGIQKFCDRV